MPSLTALLEETRQEPCVGSITPPRPNPPSTCSEGLVKRVQRGEPAAAAELYQVLVGGLRLLVFRHLGAQDADDVVHETFLAVVEVARRGQIRNPECLMGMVRTILLRKIAMHIRSLVARRNREVDVLHATGALQHADTPEQAVIRTQRTAIMRKVLASLQCREREVLTRFYLDEQPAEQISCEMGLTLTQFRLLKSRAKARFGELGRHRLRMDVPPSPTSIR